MAEEEEDFNEYNPSADMFKNNHDLIGVDGIIRAQ